MTRLEGGPLPKSVPASDARPDLVTWVRHARLPCLAPKGATQLATHIFSPNQPRPLKTLTEELQKMIASTLSTWQEKPR